MVNEYDIPICKICGDKFKGVESLHAHLKTHNVSQKSYYTQWFPRHDILTGEMIRFKNRDYYLTADFNTKENLAEWLKQVSKDEIRNYVVDFFSRRKARKGLVFSPTQVELRTLPIVGRRYITTLVDDYDVFFEDLGFKRRFELSEWGFPYRFHLNHKIIVDTREQKPLNNFTLKTRSEAMTFGDYRLDDLAFSQNVYIERKTVGDLYGTLTEGYERFLKEIAKAKDACAYLVILVEADFNTVYNYPNTSAVLGRMNIRPEHIYHRVRELIENNQHIQFLFVKDRDSASKAVERILASHGQCKQVDLQYMYDIGKF